MIVCFLLPIRFNGYVRLGVQALEDIHFRASYELYSDVLLVMFPSLSASFSGCVCVCLSLCMSVCVFVSVSVCLCVCASLCVCIYLSLCVCICVSLCICLSVCLGG